MNFTLTPAAERFVRLMLRADGGPGSGLRLVLSPGGCSGLAAQMEVEAAPRPGDAVVERGTVKLFLPAESRLLLDGVTVDFAETGTQTGLVFHDPRGTSCSSAAAAKAAQ
jgi:iron-sulfur cluster assembly protein